MARIKQSANLGSIEARRKLKARPEPYFVVIEKGLALGYRKTPEGGAWLGRRYDPKTRRYNEARLATADDNREADGMEVLKYGQALHKLMAGAKHQAEAASGKHYTVADAVADYLKHVATHAKSAADTSQKLRAYLTPELGAKRISELKPTDFDEWRDQALERSPRRRASSTATPKPIPRQFKVPRPPRVTLPVQATAAPDELRRRRRSTVNRVITSLKAALNYAHSRGKVSNRDAWAKLQKFRGVDAARLRWLTVDEAKRLINASAPDFRVLVQGGLMTGCRAGELVRARAMDFDRTSETLLVPDSKSGMPRRVQLTPEGVSLLESLTAGAPGNQLIFVRADGSAWGRMPIARGMKAACIAGNISPPATFHALRHTFASHLVQNGVPLLLVASALGHQGTRMVEKHYGHFAPSAAHQMLREKLPTFGMEVNSNVRVLQSK